MSCISSWSGKIRKGKREESVMTDRRPATSARPPVADRTAFQAELDALRAREKAHTREGGAIAAARRRLPMVVVDGATPLIGERGAVTLLDAFEGRRMHIVCYLRQGSKVFETYWTTRRGVEAMDNSYRLLDLTVYGRQEGGGGSPPGL